jgi:CBS domain-containing protein
LKVREIMVKDVVTACSSAPVDEATRIMNKNSIKRLLVVEKGETRGIITHRDLLEKVLEECRGPKQVKGSDVTIKKLVMGNPDMEIHEAANLIFKKKIKKLPVSKEKHLARLVTLTNTTRTVGANSELMDIVEKLSNMHTI